MNTPLRSAVSLSPALSVVAGLLLALSSVEGLAFAGSYEQDWLKGAQEFDHATLGGGVKPRTASAMGALQGVYSGDETSRTLVRKPGQDSMTVEMETQVYRVFTTIELVLETYEDIECRETRGEGRGDWHGLFSAPKREKAARLAQSVKGVGEATAQCILDSGAFSSKPRSWSAFKSRMKQADETCGKGTYYRVVVQYGRENAANLGYYSDQDCQAVQRQELVLRPVEHREPDHVARVAVRVRIHNAPLLPSESESINISFDGVNVTVNPSSRYNRFQVARTGDHDYVLEGQRQRVSPNNTLAVEILARGMGKVLRLTDTDFTPTIGMDSAHAQTFAKIKIRQKGDWKRAWIDKTVAETSIPLNGGSSSTDLEQMLGSSVPKGEKYYLEYSLQRMNSRLSNDSASGAKDTPEFTR